MNAETQQRSGSWITVVVLSLIVLLLLAILLPAIQQAREAARRSDCKNKLRQIGIALQNYHETHKTFPPGWIRVRGPDSGEHEQSAYGWSLYIHPAMEASPLYKKIMGHRDSSFASHAKRDVHYLGTILPAYRCPSDLGASQDLTSSPSPLGTSNYVANFGVGIPERRHDLVLMQGVFGENSCVRVSDIRDGTTNVVLVGERRMPSSVEYWREGVLDGKFSSYWPGIPTGANPLAIVGTVTDGSIAWIDLTDPDEAAQRRSELESGPMNPTGPLRGLSGNPPLLRVLRLNRLSDGTPMRNRDGDVSASYSSNHPGGVQVVLGDGSVRFLSDDIDVQTYVNLMRCSDGTDLTVP